MYSAEKAIIKVVHLIIIENVLFSFEVYFSSEPREAIEPCEDIESHEAKGHKE